MPHLLAVFAAYHIALSFTLSRQSRARVNKEHPGSDFLSRDNITASFSVSFESAFLLVISIIANLAVTDCAILPFSTLLFGSYLCFITFLTAVILSA